MRLELLKTHHCAVHLLLTTARRTPAVRASRRTVWASWLVSQYKGVAWTILGSVLTVNMGLPKTPVILSVLGDPCGTVQPDPNP